MPRESWWGHFRGGKNRDRRRTSTSWPHSRWHPGVVEDAPCELTFTWSSLSNRYHGLCSSLARETDSVLLAVGWVAWDTWLFIFFFIAMTSTWKMKVKGERIYLTPGFKGFSLRSACSIAVGLWCNEASRQQEHLAEYSCSPHDGQEAERDWMAKNGVLLKVQAQWATSNCFPAKSSNSKSTGEFIHQNPCDPITSQWLDLPAGHWAFPMTFV